MADGKVTIAVDLDGKKAQGDINSLKSSLGGLGSAFKSVLGANLVSGALMSGISALTGGVKSAFSSAIDEGAKLQQSIGGIETLFKDSAGTVKQYANEAFRTAGVSANEYMENVTSFSASLISSLGGDTAKAAELANTAMTDMSDNANKMGSDMKLITQTYQSLARGNYAMLDNLKLGYGGTKAEMQRLIKDAASYKDVQEELNMTVNEGDLSFANMVKAISVVQKKLGITGTTAKEAAETFSGSFASMQAAFKDFLGNLTTGGDISKPLENLSKTASTFVFRNFIPMVGNAFKSLPKAISTFLASAKPEIEAGLKKMLPEEMVNNIMGAFDKVGNFLSSFKDTGAITAVAGAFNAVKDAIGHVFSSLAGSGENFDKIAKALGEVVKFLADAATKGAEFISSLPPGTIQAIASAVIGMVAAFKTVSIATKAITGLKTAFGLLKIALSNPWGLAIAGIGALIGWFIQAYTTSEDFRNKVNEVVEAIGKIASKIGEFLSGIDPSIFALLLPVLGTLLSKFKGFDIIGKLNPFNLFKKNATEAFDGAGASATQSKGIIEQVFSGLGSLITSISQGISTVLQGLATAISTVAQGFGQAASMASPAQWLSMGAAMLMVGAGVALVAGGIYILVQAAIELGNAGTSAQLAMLGLGVGIAVLAGIFALLGPALTASAVGILAFGASVALIGAGIAIAAYGLSILVNAFANAEGAITATGQAISTAAQGIGQGLQTALDGAARVVESFGTAIKTALEGVANVFKSVGEAIRTVLDGIKGVIESVGNSFTQIGDSLAKIASNAGGIMNAAAGVGALATAVTGLGAASYAGNLVGFTGDIEKLNVAIKNLGSGFAGISSSFQTIGTSMSLVATSSMMAVTGLTNFSTHITLLSTTLGLLPSIMTMSVSGFTIFTAQILSSVAGLAAINAPIAMFNSQIMTMTPSLMMAGAGLSGFNAQANAAGNAMRLLASNSSVAQGQVTALGVSIQTAMSGATASISTAGNQMVVVIQSSMMQLSMVVTNSMTNASSAVLNSSMQMSTSIRTAGTQMTTTMQSTLNQIVSLTKNGMTRASQAVQQGGAQMAQHIQSSGQKMVTLMQSAINTVVNTVNNGRSRMISAGQYMSEGLAVGMRNALPAVTAAANALVAEAERAAQAKAKINSPSHLFRDEVGWWIGAGVAKGIDQSTVKVDEAMTDMYSKINAFSFKPENVLGVGKTNISHSVTAKVMREQAMRVTADDKKSQKDAYHVQNNNLLENLLDKVYDLEVLLEKGKKIVLDSGTLVGETKDIFDEAIGSNTAMIRRHQL
ncbi:phage protein [Streptococcus pneumoniae]|nr:phage protein [Streptococcus pneumoniae]VNK98265.1 phage protein [Streptococcus pneumoniae]